MLLIFGCLQTDIAKGQGTAADYQRADDLGRRVQDKVFRSEVKANWLKDGRFWYRVKTGPSESRFILVDTENGNREEAFDHKQLADSLSNATGKQVNADQLPIRTLRFSKDGKLIKFSSAGKTWEYDSKTHDIREAKTTVPANETTITVLPFPRVGTRQGAETHVTFINRTENKIKLYWINDVQNPTFYADIGPGKRHEQRTFGGHSWLVVSENKKPLGVFEATDAKGVAVIDGTWRPGRTGRRPRGEGNRQTRNGVSPDERWQATITERNVILRDRKSGKEFQLTSDGREEDAYLGRIYWSPDSKKFVVYQQRQGQNREIHVVESSPKNQLQPKLHSYTYEKPGDRIAQSRPRLFDVEKKEQIAVSDELFSNPWRISESHWSADSSQFSFLYNQRGHQVLRVVAIDAATGKANAIVDEVADTFICYSSKTFYRRLDETNEIVWMSERDGWNHLYLYDSKTGQVKNQITKGEWVVRGVDRVDVENRQIWFRAGGIHPDQDPYHVHFCRVNFDGTELVVLTNGDGTHGIEFSPDGKYFIDRYSRVDLIESVVRERV
ncbi:MAG: DPP IV N-terminal domain-containing protein, partial [Planctomycetaceae bacterium]|nr:DPP IV N-terminal domain-containing protein [Planctomycetaceae bacterium]